MGKHLSKMIQNPLFFNKGYYGTHSYVLQQLILNMYLHKFSKPNLFA